jgi:1-phosphatidylinositol-4-phosphate 5-kinase
MSNNKSLISPIPPQAYGDRFVRFITGITKAPEEVEKDREKESHEQADRAAHPGSISSQLFRTSTEKVMDKAERQARRTEDNGAVEDDSHDRILTSIRSPSAERSNGLAGATLPIVEEIGEGGSTGGRSGRSEAVHHERVPSDFTLGSPVIGGRPPPTPPKDDEREGRLLTPPKDHPLKDKRLPELPPVVPFTESPAVMSPAAR